MPGRVRRWFLDLRLGRKLTLLFGVPLLVMSMSQIVTIWALPRSDAAQTRAKEVYVLFEYTTRAGRLSVDAETGVRGYLVTRDVVFLEPYVAAREALPALMDKVVIAIGRDPIGAKLVAEATAALDARLEQLAGFVDDAVATTSEHLTQTLQVGLPLSIRARQSLRALDRHVQDRAEELAARAAEARGVARMAALSAAAALIVVALIVVCLFRRIMLPRIKHLQRLASSIGTGEIVAPGYLARDEVGVLARQIVDVSAALAKQQAELAESRGWLQAVLDHTPDIVVLRDLDDRLLLVNRAFTKESGLDEAAVLGCRSREVLASVRSGLVLPEVNAGEVVVSEVQFTASPEARTFRLCTFPVTDAAGTTVARGTIATDVTDQARARDADKDLLEIAEHANGLKSEFISRMSHELRTPLNAMLGFAQLLELEGVTPDQRDSVDHILRAGRHLKALINDVLELSRTDAGSLSVQTSGIMLSGAVRDAVDLVAADAENNGIEIRIDSHSLDHPVIADAQRLTQVLVNLLSNAVKYNRPGGTVNVDGVHTNGRFRIRVVDTGIGIAPEMMARLFDPFDRLDAESSGVAGTGIGLTIAGRLSEVMGGTLTATSQLGEGTTFTLELAAASSSTSITPVLPADPRPEALPRPPRAVLYIEDNAANITLVQRVLAQRPEVTLLSTTSGDAGVRLARSHRPHLVLLDLHLPDADGTEVLRRLQADPETAAIPVIVVSADATTGQARRLCALGARDYLTKPFDLHQLLRIVDELLWDNNAELGQRQLAASRP